MAEESIISVESATPEQTAKAELVYVHPTEDALREALAAANDGKKVKFKGYRVTVAKPIEVGTYFVFGYSNREAQGQLMATLDGVRCEPIGATVKPATVEEAIAADPTIDDKTRAALAKLLAKARSAT